MSILDTAKYIELGKQAEAKTLVNNAVAAVAPYIEKEAIRRAAPVIAYDALSRYAPAIQEQTANTVLAKLGIHPGYNAPEGLSTQLLKG